MGPMKDSGIEWIGEIPEEWEVATYHRILLRRREFNNDSKKQVLSLTINGVKEKNIEENYGKMAEDFTGHQIVKKGDLVFTPRDFDATPILSGISPSEGCISNLYFVLYGNNEVWLPFYNYFMWGVKWGGDIWKRLSYGMRFSYTYHQFASLPTVSISLAEQKTIADYLDKKCNLIDNTIEKQKTVIEKLQSYKQSLITKAVTKGFDSTVKMKSSGIEWIGDIPEGWEVRHIKTLSSVKRGASPRPIDDQKYFDQNGVYKWVRISDVSSSEMFLLDAGEKLSELGASLSVKLEPEKLIISICASVGKPCITKIKCCIHDGFVYFPELENFYTKWIFQIFSTGQCYAGLGKMGTQLNLNTDTIGKITIPIPTEIEINSILNYLDNKCAQIENVINGKQKLIDKLTDYKKSLIYECVTGKKEVTINA